MCKRGREEEEEEEVEKEGGGKGCASVCVGWRWWWRWWCGVREGFPLSHTADGADVSGCSQSQQGQVYPAAVLKSGGSISVSLSIEDSAAY